MSTMNRRSFLKSTAVAAGSTSVFAISGTAASGQILGANDRVRIAVAGVGSRGGGLINEFGKVPNVEIVYIVDADRKKVDQRIGELEKKTGKAPKGTQDYRVMLEDKEVDCVVIATIDVWHSLQTIWACQAGKDVYCEKPVSQRLFEGRKCAEAAQKYNRIVQHGTQRRSEDSWAKVAAAVQNEKYGKLIAVKTYANRPRPPIGFKPIIAPPENLDWDQWLGPAAKMEYHENLHPYNWHWFWDTGNGEIVNNGVHFFDLCLWALNKKNPSSVIAFGSRFVKSPETNYKDQGQTPTILFALYDFDGIPVIHETCNLAGPKDKWNPLETTEFYTEQGVIRGATFVPKSGEPEKVEVEYKKPEPGGHYANFINAVRSRNSDSLNAPISKGYYSASIPHWGNAAYKTGKRETFKVCREKMGNNSFLQETIDKVAANFKVVFEDSVSIDDVPFQVSEKLLIDQQKETFVNNPAADVFLSRPPRKPFAIPDEV
ncbi:MAG: Gfo/Idh/MocA family oxidoreductase [Planctomycetaceae bacterium]|nr:Gfo/Idh/MocA family oxidoreductase [Planctomycetaceae bacterium]